MTDLQAERMLGRNGHKATAITPSARPDIEQATTYQSLADESRGTGGRSGADLLGFYSIGLGLAELFAPHIVSRVIGVKDPDDRTYGTVRLMGMREIGHGISILSSEYPATQVAARVGGDMVDLALLANTMSKPENDRGRTLFATLNVIAVTALDVMTARQLARQPRTEARQRLEQGTSQTSYAVTVGRSPEEVYGFWRDFENLPTFMRHLESVEVQEGGRSHWKAKAPAGATAEWDAEIVEARPNEFISWRSIPGSGVQNSGEVRFLPAPAGRGTEVRLTLRYDPPMGKLGSRVAMVFREEPSQQAKDDLRHFKQLMETGEVVFSDSTKRKGLQPALPTPQEPKL